MAETREACLVDYFPIRIRQMRISNALLTRLFAAGLLVFSSNICHAEEPSAIDSTVAKAQNLLGQASSTMQEVLINALALTGTPYKFGGTSPESGFDCSGFVSYVFQQAANLTLPHGARAISQLGKTIPIDQLQPGDLVFYNTLKSTFSHVGIYIGDNRFVHAPSSGGGVHVVNMNDAYWAKRFNGARRIEPGALPPPSASAE